MKKIIGSLLACVTALTLFTTVLADGEKSSTTEWNAGFLGTKVEKVTEDGEIVYKASNITAQYTSPMISIKDAVSKAVGGEDGSVVITMNVRVKFKSGKEDSTTSAKALLRAEAADSTLAKDADEWNEQYQEIMGDEGMFKNSSGNIMKYCDGSVKLSDSAWTLVEWELDVTKAELDCNMIKGWNLCFDTIKDFSDLETIEIKDTAIYNADDYEFAEPEESDEEEPDDTDGDNTDNAGTSANGMKVIYDKNGLLVEDSASTPDEKNDNKPADKEPVGLVEQDGNSYWWIWVIAAVVVVGAAVTVFVIIKKKNKKQAEEN